jgi:hypothetical protein
MFRWYPDGGPDPSCPGVVQAQQEAQVRHGAKSSQGLISSVSYPYWIQIQSGQWIRIQIRIWNLDSDSGSGSSRAKMTHKSRKKFRNLIFLSARCSLLRVEGFFCSLDVLYVDLGINCSF